MLLRRGTRSGSILRGFKECRRKLRSYEALVEEESRLTLNSSHDNYINGTTLSAMQEVSAPHMLAAVLLCNIS